LQCFDNVRDKLLDSFHETNLHNLIVFKHHVQILFMLLKNPFAASNNVGATNSTERPKKLITPQRSYHIKKQSPCQKSRENHLQQNPITPAQDRCIKIYFLPIPFSIIHTPLSQIYDVTWSSRSRLRLRIDFLAGRRMKRARKFAFPISRLGTLDVGTDTFNPARRQIKSVPARRFRFASRGEREEVIAAAVA
jgi:hypothetical protein